MPKKKTQSVQMKPLTEPALIVKGDMRTMLIAGFDHEQVRDKVKILALFFRLPYSEQYTLMEHKKTGAKGIWLEVLYML